MRADDIRPYGKDAHFQKLLDVSLIEERKIMKRNEPGGNLDIPQREVTPLSAATGRKM